MTLPVLGIVAANPAAATASPAQLNKLELVMHAPGILSRSTMVGRVAPTSTITGAVGLRPRNEPALAQFIKSVTTKGSPSFHQYLRPGQFAARFGPTKATLAAVRSMLARDGLHVSGVSSNGLLVQFSGSAAKVESAFHTGLARYRLPNGTVGRATTSAVRIPASIASQVDLVAGLDNLVHASSAGLLRATKAQARLFPHAKAPKTTPVPGGPSACPAAQQAATAYGGLTDNQIANSYGASGLYKAGDTGQGQSIAIYELEPFAPSDIQTFDQCYFGSTAAAQMQTRLHVVPVDGGQPAGAGSGEAVLDIQDVSAMAPGANINVYEAPNTTFGGIDEYNQIVASDTNQLITSSWGLCETAVQQGEPGIQQQENFIFQQAAAQGQTVLAAAGDTGNNSCNAFRLPQPVPPYLSVLDPSSQPYVVSVGGTTITTATQPPAEHVWNDGAVWGAGGGGISNSWVMPSWQASTQVPGIAPAGTISTAQQINGNSFCQSSTYGGSQGQPCRELPDVSAQADEFTGAVTIYSAQFGGWVTIGGTSSATPIWAAMLALVNASPSCSSNTINFAGTNVQDIGFASPLLYAVASNPTAYAASFNDITTGNNDIYGEANGAVFPATPGYDMASGLGSPQLTSPSGGDGLAYFLCTYGVSTTRPTVSSLSPPQLSTTAGGSLTITGSNFEANGSPNVGSIWIDSYLVPASSYTVNSPTQITISNLPAGSQLVPTGGASDGAGPAAVMVTLQDGQTSQLTPGSILEVVDTAASSPSSALPAVTGVSTYGGAETGGNSVTILGSGFDTTVSSVTFGGVAATGFKVVNNYEIQATVPAYTSSGTTCATSLSAATDICQVQVVVTNGNGSSQQYPILPSYEGLLAFNLNGVMPAPPGCSCEVVPAPSEYDYFPAPQISSISTSGGPQSFASEMGSSTVLIQGSGFNDFGISSLYFGPTTSASSQDFGFSYISSTQIEVTAPGEMPTVNAMNVPVTLQTLGGTSNTMNATYSGVPVVSGLSAPAAPATGGETVNLTGNGFSDTLLAVFVDVASPFSFATDYAVNLQSNTQASLVNPAQNPAVVAVQLCTTTACSAPGNGNTMVIYPPGNPQVTSSSPSSGPAHGGTKVTITGHNLGCVTAVYFGKTLAASFSNQQALLDCGSTRAVDVVAPSAAPGTKDSITVQTVESEMTGYGASKPVTAATFTYTKSSPSGPRVRVSGLGPNSASVAWAPPATNGGSPVTFYLLRAIAKGFPTHVVRLPASARSFDFRNLYWGTTWTIWVTAHNKYGAGVVSSLTVHPKKP
ncbi:MAG: protease pro-enzyme activation domain-containing protein [Acidimicrobiales bacterium]